MSTIPRRISKYGLQEQIGSGSLGEVWKGYDLQTQRSVAIKIFHADLQADPNFIVSFQQEGHAITALHHPNIVPVLEADVSRTPESNSATAYVAMDYVEGETLADYIQRTSRKGNFPSTSAIIYLFKNIAAALDYAHQNGVVHGDIKPGNILLDNKKAQHSKIGEPMLSDFGNARLLKHNTSARTALYISPEQVKGQDAGECSDIYALGVILYEICTGVQPFRSESPVAIMMQHINALPTPPILINPNIPAGLSEVILRAMAKDPATRFRTASSFATAIANACSSQPAGQITLNDEVAQDERALSGPLMPILGVSSPVKAISPRSAKVPAISPNSMSVPAVTAAQPAVTRDLQAAKPALAATTAVLPAVRRQKDLLAIPTNYAIITVVLLLFIILSAVVTVFVLNPSPHHPAPVPPSALAGQVFFQDDALGRNDTLRIEMSHIVTPPPGNNYYAWLQGSGQTIIPLGQLSVQNGAGTLLYPGDARHTNLLSIAQGFFMTLEKNGSRSQTPSSQKVYEGAVNAASLQYIRHILYQLPGFPAKEGIATGLFETIKSINDKAGSIVDDLQGSHDYDLVWRQANRIINLIDGTDYAQSSGDLPAAMPSLLQVPVGIISSPAVPGYLDTLMAEVGKVQQVTGSNATMLQHIQNINSAIADLRGWIQKMRADCAQLLKVSPPSNLGSPAALSQALELKKLAADSYTGRTIPPNEGPLPTLGSAGMYQAYIECQYLATIDVKKV